MGKEDIKIIKLLKGWLQRPGNTKRDLAKKLKYSSGSVVSNWIARRKIPAYRQEELKKFLIKETVKHVKQSK